MRRASIVTSFGLAGLVWTAVLAVAAEPRDGVRPGGLVAWEGAGIERCALDDAEFAPLGDACLYPVDLLEERASLELVRWREGKRESTTVAVGDYPYPVERITIADDSQVHLSEADLARVEAEQARVAALWASSTPRRFELPLRRPLATLPEGGRFGSRRFINDEPRNPHSGVDYPVAAGTPVTAVAAGTVVLAEEHFFAGRSVFVDHGDGLISMYFHLSEIAVDTGQEVAAGERLGAVGASGRATGPHLHFGLRWRGARVDPSALLGPPGQIPRIGP